MNNPSDIAEGRNPSHITNAQVGEGYRLLTQNEWEIRCSNRYDPPQVEAWNDSEGRWKPNYAGNGTLYTYRLPASWPIQANRPAPAPVKAPTVRECVDRLKAWLKETDE